MNEEWTKQVDQRLSALEQRDAVSEVHRTNLITRLDAIEDTLKWLVRLIIGALVLGVIGYALKGGFVL